MVAGLFEPLAGLALDRGVKLPALIDSLKLALVRSATIAFRRGIVRPVAGRVGARRGTAGPTAWSDPTAVRLAAGGYDWRSPQGPAADPHHRLGGPRP